LASGTQTQLPLLEDPVSHLAKQAFLSDINLRPISFSQQTIQNCSGSLQSLLRSGSVSKFLLQYLLLSAAGYLGSHKLASPFLDAYIAFLAMLILISYI